MSAPGPREGEGAPEVDPAGAQALPADAGVASGRQAAAPDAQTRVSEVPPPPPTAGAAGGAVAASRLEGGGATSGGGAAAGGGASGGSASGGDVPSGPTGQAQLDQLIARLPIDQEVVEQKPEILVAGAFVGAFLLAKIIRRIGG